MKVLILAGGFGSRLSEETDIKPKPMVEIGEQPILWHIMKTYSFYGFNEFVLLLGYKSYVIKDYFVNYALKQGDVYVDLEKNELNLDTKNTEPWKIHLLETGLNSMTGGRITFAKDLIGDEPFMLTYGDGVADINILSVIEFHNKHKKKITMTAVQPEGRYGSLSITPDGNVSKFLEKPIGDGAWINGGYFVCQPSVLDYIGDRSTVFEQEPLTRLAEEGQLSAYKHSGYWACMDTLRDKIALNELWAKGVAPWSVW